jgi:SagB-type dehydrogenase family enzyme
VKINWSTQLGDDLRPPDEVPAWQEFHEISKLPTVIARTQATAFSPSIVEAFVMGRSFRQRPSPDSVPLTDSTPDALSLAAAMRQRRSSPTLSDPLTLDDLSVVISQGLGPTLVEQDSATGQARILRAWPSAGALYPLDFYVIARRVEQLPKGCYHVNLIGRRYEPVRTCSIDEVVCSAFFWQDFMLDASAIVLLVGVFERSTAKYGERGYRFTLLDAGHAAQNVLLVAEQQALNACPVGGFDDDALASALGLDGINQAVIHTILLGGATCSAQS